MVKKEDILREILLKMNYDSSKTRNENIVEQDTRFTHYLDKVDSDPKSAAKYHKDMSEISELIYEYRHGLIDIAAFGTLFIPLMGPFISLGLELANSGLYFAEGENYSGGLALVFALIPFGEILRKIPAVEKIGINGLKKLLQKTAIKNAKYTDDEIKVLKGINDNKKWITTRASRQAVKETIKATFKGQPLKRIITTMYYLGKRNPKLLNISKMGLIVGGLWYSYDKLAEIYGIKNKNQDLEIIKKIENDYNNNPNNIILQIVPQLSSTTDEEKNKELMKAFNDAFKDSN